ncbi:DUF6376 family protein [Miniphocaeibacter halophilus]|uniref:Uncharacterized protein n=1 Tax=Miniphocaeibacter halophilus TaxID=2931922 RepID=A0AC61MQA3_9FIRM|nr:DUF6376 family protein [Miniphocaeibacter halophilus]QQK07865.1 hypothetical protein JFY71_11420 [Miniphocaeibacter halophilus]
MKKIGTLLIALMLIVTACSNNSSKETSKETRETIEITESVEVEKETNYEKAFSTYNETLLEKVELLLDSEDSIPEGKYTEEWEQGHREVLAEVKDTINTFENIEVPEKYKSVHEKYIEANDQLLTYINETSRMLDEGLIKFDEINKYYHGFVELQGEAADLYNDIP